MARPLQHQATPFVVPLRPAGPLRDRQHRYAADGCVITARVQDPGVGPLRGAVYYTDGQLEDDARLVIALARTAAAHGADVLTRCAATDLREDRLTLTDETTGESVEARGTVVSATGVWAG
ncbi:hypothetical protein CGZ92_01565 [Parenemella sanctibonifatiensis]|uniref:FAD dependent oxidoreductase domain-containing protein n=1 Tax=Parenemella sanctibonifatiensis TaxID=2016505 RepID=A0A255EL24_9ACTN|nr:hypothetical protein CGZ92_01565 [Parenemella sanctibonifatiensis]